MFLIQKICVRKYFQYFQKNDGEMSLQRVCLAEFSLLISFGQICFSHFSVVVSLQKVRGRECFLIKTRWRKASAKILFVRDFSSDIFWWCFFLKHLSGVFLENNCVRQCFFNKEMVEQFSVKFLFGREFFSDIFSWGFVSKHFSVDVFLRKTRGRG